MRIPWKAFPLLGLACAGVACAPAFQESGYLVHNDSRYDAVTDPSKLFEASGDARTELVFDSRDLDLDRGFLRYRILTGERYLTVHDLPDPEFQLPEGRYRFAVQPIDLQTYVSGTRVTYGYPELVEVELGRLDRVVVRLLPLASGGIRTELERSPAVGARAPNRPEAHSR